ncbi:MAG TPA: hypothetical protein DD670_08540 [Planctomycetaceae bacterium]|nr:hypothetical protein [Planctomycetaceae bacterium]
MVLQSREFAFAIVCLAVGLSAGCDRGSRSNLSAVDDDRLTVGVSNSYLAAIATDLSDRVKIVPLAAPGMCPGHFDLRPSQIEALGSAKLLLRFDFQTALEEKLAGRLGTDLTIARVSLPGGMCDPDSYEAACRQVADAFVERGIISAERAEARMADIAARMTALRAFMKEQVGAARMAGKPVVASVHQETFCRVLGLDVVATLTGGDGARASALDAAVAAGEQAGVKWIIANRPEGRRMADFVADRLGAVVLVFDNFPDSGEPAAFDRLVRSNVRTLVEGAAK